MGTYLHGLMLAGKNLTSTLLRIWTVGSCMSWIRKNEGVIEVNAEGPEPIVSTAQWLMNTEIANKATALIELFLIAVPTIGEVEQSVKTALHLIVWAIRNGDYKIRFFAETTATAVQTTRSSAVAEAW